MTVSASKDYFSEKNYLTIREIIGLLATESIEDKLTIYSDISNRI